MILISNFTTDSLCDVISRINYMKLHPTKSYMYDNLNYSKLVKAPSNTNYYYYLNVSNDDIKNYTFLQEERTNRSEQFYLTLKQAP